ncbi:MAG: hypothetical protein MASP_00516 [Candidatus Methanolliviera sp. GoM_asphalt]|nr:MAG: hypothetical protein MASP_00516 [Candidatus Methanolliviera sp. GoM_asphalt]
MEVINKMVETSAAMCNCALVAFGIPTACLIALTSALISVPTSLASVGISVMSMLTSGAVACDSVTTGAFDWITNCANMIRLGK